MHAACLPPATACRPARPASPQPAPPAATALTHAILIEPAHAGELQPLLQHHAFSMLPLANRPLLHHHLSRLAASGIREVDLFLAHLPSQTQAYADGGRPWGLQLRCHSLVDAERLWTDSGRLSRFVRGASLVMALDRLPDEATLQRLCRTRVDGSRWLVGADGEPLRIGRLHGGSAPLYETSAGQVRRLHRARDYVDANQSALAALAGTHHVERPLGRAGYAGARARIAETAQLPGAVMVGAGATVGRRCIVGDGCIVGAGAWLDDDAEVRDSVVLDDTYVGPHALLRGKVVSPHLVIDAATGVAMHLEDERLLGSTRAHLLSESSLHRATERALAAFALALLAPAVAARALWCRLRRQPVFERQTVYLAPRRGIGGQSMPRPLTLWRLAGVAHPGWRRLPWLWAVTGGALPLAGPTLPATRPSAAAAAGTAAGHFAMLRCGATDVPPALAELDFLRDAGPRLSARTLLAWLGSLCRPAPRVAGRGSAASASPSSHQGSAA